MFHRHKFVEVRRVFNPLKRWKVVEIMDTVDKRTELLTIETFIFRPFAQRKADYFNGFAKRLSGMPDNPVLIFYEVKRIGK